MKWAVLILAALNLGFLGYQFGIGKDLGRREGPAPASTPASTGGLLLLTELHGQTLRLRRTPSPQPAEPELDPGVQPSADPVPTPVADGALAAPTPVATARPGTAGHPVQCFAIGPLRGAAPVEAMRSWFDARGVAARVTRRERREVAFHWVFLPPFASREEAQAKVLEMTQKGIADMVVLRKGDMANAISLGAFSRRKSLQRRVDELRQKGYQPSTARRDYATLARWIDVVAGEELREAEFKTAFPTMRMSERPCDSAELQVHADAGRP